MLQQFNHPLAHIAGLGSSIDINLVRRSPLGFMGEGDPDMPLTDADVKKIAAAVWSHTAVPTGAKDKTPRRMDHSLVNGMQRAYEAKDHARDAAHAANRANGKLDAVTKVLTEAGAGMLARVANVQAQVAKLVASAPAEQVKVDAGAIADAVIAKLRALSLIWKN
jgi:hypothetical protein